MDSGEAFDLHYNAHCFDHTVRIPAVWRLLEALKEQGSRRPSSPISPTSLSADRPSAVSKSPFRWFGAIGGMPHQADPASLLEPSGSAALAAEDCLYIRDSDVDVHGEELQAWLRRLLGFPWEELRSPGSCSADASARSEFGNFKPDAVGDASRAD